MALLFEFKFEVHAFIFFFLQTCNFLMLVCHLCCRRIALTIIKCFSNFGNLCNPVRRKSKYFSRGRLPEDLGFVPESLIVCQLILGVAHDILLSDESFLSTTFVAVAYGAISVEN